MKSEVEFTGFSEIVEGALRVRVGSISVRDPHAIQFHLDELDAAVDEVAKIKAESAFCMADVQRSMREIQHRFVTQPDLKVTQAERLYKIDPEHRDLEQSLAKFKAVYDYCEAAEGILKNKFFELKAKGR